MTLVQPWWTFAEAW